MKIDEDLRSCLEYNPQEFDVCDIAAVLAVHEGARDAEDWRWILRLHDGRFAAMQGRSCYTGWDCYSNATSVIVTTIADALAFFRLRRAEYDDNSPALIADLANQLLYGKTETWREGMDRQFGIE